MKRSHFGTSNLTQAKKNVSSFSLISRKDTWTQKMAKLGTHVRNKTKDKIKYNEFWSEMKHDNTVYYKQIVKMRIRINVCFF